MMSAGSDLQQLLSRQR